MAKYRLNATKYIKIHCHFFIKTEEEKTEIWSSQADISDTSFDQKSPGHREVDALSCHKQTDRQTNRQTDIATL